MRMRTLTPALMAALALGSDGAGAQDPHKARSPLYRKSARKRGPINREQENSRRRRQLDRLAAKLGSRDEAVRRLGIYTEDDR